MKYYAGDPGRAAAEAALQAEITHAHTEGIAGAVAVGGDMDTTAAIVGGIIAAGTGTDGIPPDWLAAREPLPGWLR